MIETTVIVDEEAEVVTVAVTSLDATAIGTSKCMPEDSFDLDIGVDLALARALQKLGKTLERDSFASVHERDRERQRREELSEAARQRKAEATYQFQCEFAALIEATLNNPVVVKNPSYSDGDRVRVKDDAKLDNGKYAGLYGTITRSTPTYVRVNILDGDLDVPFYRNEIEVVNSLQSTGSVLRDYVANSK